jgi:hypothetical protein
MVSKDFQINGLNLPSQLAHFLEHGKPSKRGLIGGEEKAMWYSIFSPDEIDYPGLYSKPLSKTNEMWQKERREIFVGKADGIADPGYLCPERSVLIGELGQDALIALDFARSHITPTVVYLKWYQPYTVRWTCVANSVDSFLRKLHLL